MKKLLFLAGIIVASYSANAQYSQWVYGTSNSYEELGNGKVLPGNSSTSQGHIMAGYSVFSNSDLYVVKNSLNGTSLGAPYFNNLYTISDPGGNILQITTSKIAVLPNNLGYGVSGLYYNPGTGMPGIYYLWLNQFGNPAANPVSYQVNPIAAPVMNFGNIKVGPSGTLYITGNCYNMNGTSPNSMDFFVLRVRNNGLLMWGNVYNIFAGTSSDEMGYDVLESQIMPNEVVVVGTHDGGVFINDGFFLRINATNGAAITGIAHMFGTAAGVDEFYSIEHSFAPVQGTKGYLICGKTNSTVGGDYDLWGLRIDPMGAIVFWTWAYQYNDGAGGTPDNWGAQVIERLNTMGTYECYFVGTTMNGLLGFEDITVFKTDMFGNNVPGGQFTYGGSGWDYGMSLDQNNMAAGTGLAVFGYTMNSFSGLGSSDYYFIKAYFNGLSGCNEDIRNHQETPGPPFYFRRDFTIVAKLVQTPLIFSSITPYQEMNLCFNPTIPGGSNALQAKEVTDLATQELSMDENAVLVTPNPAQATSNVQLNVTARTGHVDVIVADYMGREYINERFEINNDGEHVLTLELAKANLNPGLYILRVNGLDKPASQVLVIK